MKILRFETDGRLNIEAYRIFLHLFWQVIFLFVAQQIFPFAQYIQHPVYLMHKLIVFHQICYGCQIPLNVQIRMIAEIIKLTDGYSNKMQWLNTTCKTSVHHTFTSSCHESGTILVVLRMKCSFRMIYMPQMWAWNIFETKVVVLFDHKSN